MVGCPPRRSFIWWRRGRRRRRKSPCVFLRLILDDTFNFVFVSYLVGLFFFFSPSDFSLLSGHLEEKDAIGPGRRRRSGRRRRRRRRRRRTPFLSFFLPFLRSAICSSTHLERHSTLLCPSVISVSCPSSISFALSGLGLSRGEYEQKDKKLHREQEVGDQGYYSLSRNLKGSSLSPISG